MIVFDIDGTLSDPTHRLHLIRQGPNKHDWPKSKKWPDFFAAAKDDSPIPEIVQLAQDLGTITPIEFWTGRPDSIRVDTLEWLRQHIHPEIQNKSLKMRRAGDYRPDTEVKLEILEQHESTPAVIFEDRFRVVDAYRAAGIRVLHVAKGDY